MNLMATEAAVERTVQGLDPIARGVLDLSLRHDFSDTSIAQVVGRSDHDVAELRRQTMARVAAELGFEGDDALERTRAELLTVPAEIWIGMPAPAPEPQEAEPEAEPEREPEEAEPEPEPEEPEAETETAPQTEPEPEPEPEPASPAKREPAEAPRTNGLVLIGLMLAAALVVVLFLSRSGDDEPQGAPAPAAEVPPAPAPQSEPAPAVEPPPEDAIVLEPLPGASTEGTVTVSVGDDGVARVDLDGLREPGGVYALWLFTSLISSQHLGTTDSGDGVIIAELPANAASYAFLDLSLEQSPADRLHSGRSVTRIATSTVLQADE
jgi:hypothetical protein